jgi:hypothetical protein
MRRVVSTMTVAVLLFLGGGAAQVNGQESCSFEQGFAVLRELVGEQKVGACLENEHVNAENGNTEQRTSGGLLVWRKADNFTAFTDGGTTWVNGPNGLQSRPNDERLSWELEPVGPARSSPSPTPRPLPTLPPRGTLSAEPVAPPLVSGNPVTGGPGTIASPNYAAQAGAGDATASPTAVSRPTSSTASAAAPTTVGTPTSAAASAATPTTANSSTSVAVVAATPTAATPTRTPTPKPAVTVKFLEMPDDVDTGNDARFEVQTSAKKGTCALVITYRNTSDAAIGSKDIDDDGRCEWKFTLAPTTKTGKAKAVVSVVANGGTASAEDTFEVKKGDTVFAGSVELEVDPTDMPDDVDVGEEIKIGVDTSLKRKGSCELSVTWPKVGPVAGESQMPDDSGRCSWKMKVPLDVPTKSTATLLVTVRKDGSTVRTLTKEFKVAK